MNYEIQYEQAEEYLETCFNNEADKQQNMLLDLVACQNSLWNN